MDDTHTKSAYNQSAQVYDEVVNKFWPFGRKEAMKCLGSQLGEKSLK